MKKKEFEKLKTRSEAELKADLAASQEKLWQTSRDILAGKQKNVREVRAIRVDIARMLTLINAKKATTK